MKIQHMFSPLKDRILLLLLLTFIFRLRDDIPKWCYMFERKGKPPNKYVYVCIYIYMYVIPGFFSIAQPGTIATGGCLMLLTDPQLLLHPLD